MKADQHKWYNIEHVYWYTCWIYQEKDQFVDE